MKNNNGYSKEDKSLIRNSDKVKQAIDFSGFVKGNVSPSDIDVVLEFNDKYLIMLEIKQKGKRLPMGQKLLLERMARAWGNWNKKEAIVIFCTHDVKDFSKDVPLSSVEVEQLYVPVQTELAKDSWGWVNWKKPLKDTLNSLGTKWGIENKLQF